MEEDQNSEVLEVTPQDQESNVIESSETPEENQQVEGSHEPEDKQERNWKEARRLRRESEIREKAKDELIEKLLAAQKTPVQEEAPVVDEFDGIPEEEFLTKGQSRKMSQKDARTIAREEVRKAQKEQQDKLFVHRLQSKYPDFNEVVNPDSIALLEEKEPDLALTIASLKDPYKMGETTYKFLMKSGLTDSVPDSRHAKEVQKKIEKNEKIVQSPQAYDKRPMAQAFKATEAEKTALFEEMMGYAGQGSGY